MFTIRSELRQHAVGQGGFHSGRFQFQSSPLSRVKALRPETEIDPPAGELHYVYDCWSEQSPALTIALASYRRVSRGHTDLLFVSQIHSAHLCGIDRLQAMAPARTVVVPYLDLIDLAMLALTETDKGHCSCTLIDYARDPVAWWRSRGAKSIIFIEPDDGSPTSKTTEAFERSEVEPDRLASQGLSRPDLRVRACLVPPRGHVPDDLSAAPSGDRDPPEGAVLAGRDSAFSIQQKSDRTAQWRTMDWSLRPYVHQPATAARATFRRDLSIIMGFRRASLNHVRKVVLDTLESTERTSRLIDNLQDKSPQRASWALSMSLYSGPQNLDNSTALQNTGGLWRHEADTRKDDASAPVGWLCTGSIKLSEDVNREPWKAYYSTVASQIGYLCLPAYSETQSFHADLLEFAGLALHVVIAGSSVIYSMPTRTVIEYIRSAGKRITVVDESWDNELTVLSHRTN